MKKLSFWFLSLLAVTMLTSCLNDNNEPVDKRTDDITINSRSVSGDKVVFSQNVATFTLDKVNMTLSISGGYLDANGAPHTFTTPEMTLTPMSSGVYSFKSEGNLNIRGRIDLMTYTIWYTFGAEGANQTYCTSQLIYSHGTTTVTNPENGNKVNNTNSQYMFSIDAKCEKCAMAISDFAPNLTGSIQASRIYWEGLSITPTTTGYVITAAEAQSNYQTASTAITDLHVTIDDQCNVLNGSFKCNGVDISMRDTLFPADINSL